MRRLLVVLLLIAVCGSARAGDVMVNYGGGPQPDTNQRNKTAGIDYTFYTFKRSPVQYLEIGTSYTWLSTNTRTHDSLYAISIYPQLRLVPGQGSWFTQHLPAWARPFFFVRALGPTYISENRLGSRQQAHHFAFQAQVGFGVLIRDNAIVMLSFKHFSNANIFHDNDGIDLPLVLSIGIHF